MRLGRIVALGGLFALWATPAAEAGWQSVFEVTCFHRSTPCVSGYTPVAAGYADPCCNPCNPCQPCPQQVCTTRYVQRSYYQPVTSYQTRTYYEPVTTYRTSYYYEPVTCYKYTCCYDPCTCSYRQVATPVTSYQLRTACTPVQSWVQRCCSVPVTTYQKVCYWEPQTCCSLVDPCTGAAVASSNGAASQPAVTTYPTPAEQPAVPAAPGVQEYKNGGSGGGSGGSGSPLYDRNYKQPEGSSSALRTRSAKPATPPAPAPAFRPAQPPPAPIVPRLNSVAFDAPAKNNGPNLLGHVVAAKVKPDLQLTFVSEDDSATDQRAAVDRTGRFKATLAAGNWLVYSQDDHGKPVYQTRVAIRAGEIQQMALVSR